MPSRLTRIWMWSEACAKLDRVGHLQRSFFRPAETSVEKTVWEPPADIFESRTEILISVGLPGVTPEQLSIEEMDDTIKIVAERRISTTEANMRIRCLEIPYGRFERQFNLPSRRLKLVGKTLENGCLHLRLRKLISEELT